MNTTSILLVVLLCLMEVSLAKKESKIPGLVLPAIALIYYSSLAIGSFNASAATSDMAAMAEAFLRMNFPTGALIAVYILVRVIKRSGNE